MNKNISSKPAFSLSSSGFREILLLKAVPLTLIHKLEVSLRGNEKVLQSLIEPSDIFHNDEGNKCFF